MKTLLFDIEVAPNLAYVWGKWQQDVIAYEKEWDILTFAFKWEGDTEVQSMRSIKNNDYILTKKLWQLFDEADVIIGHNGDKFDIKKSNTRFLAHGMSPPSPYKTIDTLKVARKYFGFNGNSLNDIAKFLGLDPKIETGGFKLWQGCMKGDTASFNKMIEYNKHDVELLEQIYLKMRPWIESHPNKNLYDATVGLCHVCCSDEIIKRGYLYTKTRKYQRYCCKKCGKWMQGELIKE